VSRYAARRVLLLIPTLLAVYTLTFALYHVTPGGPWTASGRCRARRSSS